MMLRNTSNSAKLARELYELFEIVNLVMESALRKTGAHHNDAIFSKDIQLLEYAYEIIGRMKRDIIFDMGLIVNGGNTKHMLSTSGGKRHIGSPTTVDNYILDIVNESAVTRKIISA